VNTSLLSVSVVICTVNRCESLRTALASVSEWRSAFAELIVVYAPSTDATEQVIAEYREIIDRLVICPEKNVALARNLGLQASSQEIVMYLDDDILPVKEWLDAHLEIYASQGTQCGCVAGAVRDKTKPHAPLQFAWGINSLLSESKPILSEEKAKKYTANSYWFPAVMGANVSYKRDALCKIGGFDNFFEYFLEETDVCLRLIQAGDRVWYTDFTVDHYPAKSHNREDQKHLTCWYSLAKNTTYFAIKHGWEQISIPILITRLTFLLIYRCLLRILRLKLTHNLPISILLQYIQQSAEGVRIGWEAGMRLHQTKGSKIKSSAD
jgi:hypothetical protein